MAATKFICDRNTDILRQAFAAIGELQSGSRRLERARAAIITSVDGDINTPANFDQVATLGGFESGDYADPITAAKEAMAEINELYTAVNGIQTTLNNVAAKFGIVV